MRTPATHPFAVEIHQHGNSACTVIGLLLFGTRQGAEDYVKSTEDSDFDGHSEVRKARKTDKEFA